MDEKQRVISELEKLLARPEFQGLTSYQKANLIYLDVIRNLLWEEKDKWVQVIYREVVH